jgi:hypothetical protein
MNVDKMKLRRMAMEKMMSEGPSIVSKMKKKDPMDMDMEDGEKDEKGFIQMAVSPEEKEMILSARKEKGGESEEMEDDSDDMEVMA